MTYGDTYIRLSGCLSSIPAEPNQEIGEIKGGPLHVWDLIGSDPLVRQQERLVRRLRRLPVTALCDAGLDLARFGLKRAS